MRLDQKKLADKPGKRKMMIKKRYNYIYSTYNKIEGRKL